LPQKRGMKKYIIMLTKDEVLELNSIINKGCHSSQSFRAAYVLLNCDEGEFSDKVTNEQICKVLKIGMRTIDRIKNRFIEGGLEGVLERKPSNRNYEKKMDGETEAKLIQLCCSEPPKGYAKWSLRLLADKMVELNYVDSISYVSVGNVLKKTNLNPGK
jgi:transposase